MRLPTYRMEFRTYFVCYVSKYKLFWQPSLHKFLVNPLFLVVCQIASCIWKPQTAAKMTFYFCNFVLQWVWLISASFVYIHLPFFLHFFLLKPLSHAETFCWDLCATVLRNMSQQALHRVTWSVSWNFFNFRFTKSITALSTFATVATIAVVTKTRVSPSNTTMWNLFAESLHTCFS